MQRTGQLLTHIRAGEGGNTEATVGQMPRDFPRGTTVVLEEHDRDGDSVWVKPLGDTSYCFQILRTEVRWDVATTVHTF